MPLTFAYGANMDVAAMAQRCPRSKPLGIARLMRHRLVVMREGWLSVTRDAQSTVHGVLWDVALADVAALDRFEGVGEGLYAKILQAVVAEGGAKRALVYVGANAGPGVARADYLDAVIAAARHWSLPTARLERLTASPRRSPESAKSSTPSSASPTPEHRAKLPHEQLSANTSQSAEPMDPLSLTADEPRSGSATPESRAKLTVKRLNGMLD